MHLDFETEFVFNIVRKRRTNYKFALNNGSNSVIDSVRRCRMAFSLVGRSSVSLPHIIVTRAASNVDFSMIEAVELKRSCTKH